MGVLVVLKTAAAADVAVVAELVTVERFREAGAEERRGRGSSSDE